MKVRTGFVSNSSSSSFVLDVSGLKKSQKNRIRNHIEFAKAKFHGRHSDDWYFEPAWDIQESGDIWHCFTVIDNFDLYRWVTEFCGVSPDRISGLDRHGDD